MEVVAGGVDVDDSGKFVSKLATTELSEVLKSDVLGLLSDKDPEILATSFVISWDSG